MRDFIPSLVIAIFALGLILIWELAPSNDGEVIAVFGPNTDLRKALMSTNARLMGKSRLPGGYILLSNTPGLPERLRNQGALLVLNAAYSKSCLSASSQQPAKPRSFAITTD